MHLRIFKVIKNFEVRNHVRWNELGLSVLEATSDVGLTCPGLSIPLLKSPSESRDRYQPCW